MMPEWRRRLAEQAGQQQAARIAWYQRRHHCWEPPLTRSRWQRPGREPITQADVERWPPLTPWPSVRTPSPSGYTDDLPF